MRCVVELAQVDVRTAAVVVAKLRETNREVGAKLDERQYLPLQCGDTVDGRDGDLGRAPEVGGRVLPPARAGEVDDLARSERGGEATSSLFVDQLPAGVGDRRVRAKEVVHRAAPFMLPMPS